MKVDHAGPATRRESDKRKRSIYLPRNLLDRVEAEAVRQACSVSRIVQLAWVVAEPLMARYPTMVDVTEKAVARRAEVVRARDIAKAAAQAQEAPHAV